jgi:hypothetical protein
MSRDILHFETLGEWPNQEIPKWIRTVTQDFPSGPEILLRRLAVFRVKMEVMQRYVDIIENPEWPAYRGVRG